MVVDLEGILQQPDGCVVRRGGVALGRRRLLIVVTGREAASSESSSRASPLSVINTSSPA
jgi:hypothetical protein